MARSLRRFSVLCLLHVACAFQAFATASPDGEASTDTTVLASSSDGPRAFEGSVCSLTLEVNMGVICFLCLEGGFAPISIYSSSSCRLTPTISCPGCR